MRKLLPLILALIGLAIGTGAGYALRPAPADCTGTECAEPDKPPVPPKDDSAEYIKLPNQFIVPDLRNGVVTTLIVMTLGLETGSGKSELVFSAEPKLRDTFLQILFDHANAGGFRGDFTSADKMDDLRRALLEGARSILGPDVRAVLISDIMRQDNP